MRVIIDGVEYAPKVEVLARTHDTVGSLLNRTIRQKGLKRREAAELCGVKIGILNHTVGDFSQLTVTHAARICAGLDIPPAELLSAALNTKYKERTKR